MISEPARSSAIRPDSLDESISKSIYGRYFGPPIAHFPILVNVVIFSLDQIGTQTTNGPQLERLLHISKKLRHI